MTRRAAGAVPPFLVLAGHPVRWRMLVELAGSDRQVAELTRALGKPQGLVSYHLARLRDGGLVSSHKSSFDGRSVYYRVHLDRCGELLAATGETLHPGLRGGGPAARAEDDERAHTRATVLFVCTGNGTRSQIAEALLRDRAGDAIDVASAGSHPKPIHPNAVSVLAERGIDISAAQSKPLAQFQSRRLDFVVTLCDRVREVCPEFPGHPRAMHWSIEDPSRAPGTLRSTMPAFRAVAEDLATRIGFLVSLIDNESHTTGSHTTDSHKEHTRHGR